MDDIMTADDRIDPFFRPWTTCIELQRVDCTNDVERFDDAAAMQARYDEIVASRPDVVFVAAIADGRPVTAFRRDGHPSLLALSPERQKRAQYLCVGAQSRHMRRYGENGILATSEHSR